MNTARMTLNDACALDREIAMYEAREAVGQDKGFDIHLGDPVWDAIYENESNIALEAERNIELENAHLVALRDNVEESIEWGNDQWDEFIARELSKPGL